MSEGWKNFETLESHIAKEQRMHPNSRGIFSNVLRRIGVASKVIQSKVQRAGLVGVLGSQNQINIQGETQMKLDLMANEIMKAAFNWMPAIAGIASEEEEQFICYTRTEGYEGDRYIVLFDPLDGSSNIDANVSIGLIFSIYKCKNRDSCELSDFLQQGRELEAAGYVVYGPSTVLIYTTGHGVHGFTLDPDIGEFILSHENIKIPDVCKCLSVNESNYKNWDEGTKKFINYVKEGSDPRYQKTTSRYIGSLVSDFHRNLMYGGIFLYPADAKTKKGKLRLLYECAPLAKIVEEAGGKASNGLLPIVDIVPTAIHQRVPMIIGCKEDVERYEAFVKAQG